MARRTTVPVTAAALIEALEEKKSELVRKHQAQEKLFESRAGEVRRKQRGVLEDALVASQRGLLVEVQRYSDDEVSEGYYGLALPAAPYRPRLDVGRYDRAIGILKVASPDERVVIGTDDEYSHLLSG